MKNILGVQNASFYFKYETSYSYLTPTTSWTTDKLRLKLFTRSFQNHKSFAFKMDTPSTSRKSLPIDFAGTESSDETDSHSDNDHIMQNYAGPSSPLQVQSICVWFQGRLTSYLCTAHTYFNDLCLLMLCVIVFKSMVLKCRTV